MIGELCVLRELSGALPGDQVFMVAAAASIMLG
jgi:hypothetical protein